jgi:hypothetical protein
MKLSLDKMELTKAHRDCLTKAYSICAKLAKADDCESGEMAAKYLEAVLFEYKPNGEASK